MSLEFIQNGESILIDEGSLTVWVEHSWYIGTNGRQVVATIGGERIQLHRHLMSAPKGMEVDHINGNPLDNRICNLRLCSHAENMRNRKMHKNNKVGVKGVYLSKRPSLRPFISCIRLNGKTKHLGRYSTVEEAGAAYAAAAKIYHGDFVRN